MQSGKKLIKGIMVGAFCVLSVCFMKDSAYATEINVSVPVEKSVFQRDYSNTANIKYKVKTDDNAASSIEARVVSKDNKVVSDWTSLKKENDSYCGVSSAINACNDWYKVEFRALDANKKVVATSTVNEVGVGEVFITGGQSNSACFGEKKTVANSDMVVSIDVANNAWVHCEDVQPNTSGFNNGNGKGSPWPTCGDLLNDKLNVPIAFVSTGVGGSLMEEMIDPEKNYKPISEAIKYLAPYGCRAFLIHQGEADSGGMNGKPGTDMAVYKEQYQKLIDMSRKDAGYDLNWMIARVSYAWSGFNNKSRMEEVTSTQTSLANKYNVFVGPCTDDMQGDYRLKKDHLHMSESGLIEHGKRWSEYIIDTFFKPHKITISDEDKAKLLSFKDEYCASQKVSVVCQDSNYYIKDGAVKVTDANGEEIPVENNTFIMRDEDGITVSVEFTEQPQYKKDLYAKIAKGQKTDSNLYTEQSYKNYSDVLEQALIVFYNNQASEEEVKSMISKIDEVEKSLALKPTNNNVNPDVKDPVVVKPIILSKVKITKATRAKNGKSAVLKWKKVKNAKKYEVIYSTSKKLKKSVVKKVTKSTSITIKKLKKSKKYYFKVRAVAGKKAGAYSKVKKF